MADSQLYSPNDSVITILQYCSASQLGKVQDLDVQNLLTQNPLPSFSSKDISSIISNRQQGQLFPAALKGIQFNFAFKSNCLIFIKSLQFPNPTDFEAVTRFILFSYISLIYKYETIKTWPEITSDLLILFDLFLFISRPINIEIIQSCFFSAFIIFINSNFTNDDFSHGLTSLQNFIYKGGKSLTKVDVFFEISLSKLTSSQKTSFSTNVLSILNLIKDTILNNNLDFSAPSAEHIIWMISREILAFDGTSLQLFGLLSQFVSEPTKVQIIEMISNTLNICVNQSKLDIPITAQTFNPVNPNKPFSISFSFPEETVTTFSDGFDIKKDIHRIEIVPSYKDLLETDLYEKVVSLCKALNLHIDILSILISSIGKSISKSQKVYIAVALLTVFYYEIRQNQSISLPQSFPKVTSFIQTPLLYNKEVVCDEAMKMFNSLRHYFFGIMLDENETLLVAILNDSGRFPLFLKETILRMIDYKSKMINILSKSTLILKPLSTAISYIQQLCFEGRNEFDSVRLVILQFVFLLSSLNAIVKKNIFEDMMFVTSYLSFIFDPNVEVKKFVMNQIEESLKSSQENSQSAIISTIYSIIAVMKTDFAQDRNAQIIIDLIGMMNDILDSRPELSNMFSMIGTALFDAFQEIKNTKKCEEFFVLGIKLLIRVSPNFPISVRNKDVFENAVFVLYESNPPKSILENFIQLMLADDTFYLYSENGETNKNVSGCRVKNNGIICVIYEIFEKTEFRNDIVKFFDQLLDEPNNVIAFRTANFDKQLLQLFASDYKKNEDLKKLFSKIVVNLTSVSVVLSYVSYLSPVMNNENKPCFSKNMPILLDYLDELLCMTLDNQSEATRLVPMKQNKPHLIKLDKNNPSFTYCCWLSVDKMFPQYFPQLFSSTDDDNNSIEVFISMYKIKIQIDPQKINKSITMEYNLPIDQWSFVALSFYSIDETTTATAAATTTSTSISANISASTSFGGSANISASASFGGSANISASPSFGGSANISASPSFGSSPIINSFPSSDNLEDVINDKYFGSSTPVNVANDDNDSDSNSTEFEDLSDHEDEAASDFPTDNFISKSSSNVNFYEAMNRSYSNIQSCDDVYVDLIVDGRIVATSKFNKKFMVKGNCKFNFCGTLPNSLQTNFASKVGPFAVYNLLDVNKAKKMMNEEQRFFGRCLSSSQKPLYLYQPYSNGPQQRQSSFSAILIKKCKLELLSPLFKFIGYKLEDGSEYPNYIDVVFKIFEDSFKFGSVVEESYAYSGGFGIIEQVLLENESSLLTYDLYLRFYNLLNVIQSDRLKSNLLNYIIINMNLWISSPYQEQILIQKHWLREVYPNYIRSIVQLQSFMNLFNLIILNYHEKADGVIISRHFINQVPKNFNNEESIKIMFQILYLVALKTFELNDFILLASYLLKTKSVLLIKCITDLIKRIINEKKSSITEIFMHKKAIALMHLILINGSSDASKSLIEIIILIHKKEKLFEGMTLYEHLNVLMHDISPNVMDKNYVDYLLNLMQSLNTPELFPQICYIACNLKKKDDYQHLLNGLQPSGDFVCGQFWSVWPIALAARSEQTFADEMMKFIAMCSKNDWVEVINTIEAVCNILQVPSSALKRFFIKKSLRIINKENIDFMSYDMNFIQIVYKYIFYRDIRYNSIEMMFPKSPFADILNSSSIQRTTSNVTPRHSSRRRKTESMNRSASLSFTYSPLQDSILNDSLNPTFVNENAGDDDVDSVTSSAMNGPPSLSLPKISALASDLESMKMSERRHSIRKTSIDLSPLTQPINNNVNGTAFIRRMLVDTEIQCGKFMFGCRFDPETGKWVDRDILNYVLHFLFKAKSQFFVQFQLLLIFFVLHDYEDKRVYDYLKTIKISDELRQPLQQLIDLICFKLKQNPKCANLEFLNYMSSPTEYIQNGLMFFDSKLIPMTLNNEDEVIVPLMKNIMKFIQRWNRVANKFLSIPLKKCVNLWENSQKVTFVSTIGSSIKREKAWENLFESFTISNTPWESLAPKTRIYKRNQKACFLGCPFVIVEDYKRNKKTLSLFDEKERFESSYYGNKLFDLYDFQIHDEAANCQIITIDRIVDAIVVMTDHELKFSMVNNKIKHYGLNNVSRIWRTTVLHKPTAFEIVFKTGDSFIVNFLNENSCVSLFTRLLPFAKTFNAESAMISWLNKEISNFEYLMILNYVSGRSFNNASQYPIFPWILTDFDSQELDLKDEKIYRDLSLPAGALSPEKLKVLVEKMSCKMSEKTLQQQMLQQQQQQQQQSIDFDVEKEKGKSGSGRRRRRSNNNNNNSSNKNSPNSSANNSYTKENDFFNEVESKEMFLYSKSMSSPLDVFTYLDRIEPFTTLHKLTKDSIKDLKSSASTSSSSSSSLAFIPSDEDVKELDVDFTSIKSCFIELLNNQNVVHELIPEFFFFPEFLSTSKNDLLQSVKLPNWAESPIDFVYKMRKALESDYVSQNLPDWVDLIWGFKQSGTTKLDSFNNFDPRLYDDAMSALGLKGLKSSMEIDRTKILNGQIPKQLFSTQHPIRTDIVNENESSNSGEVPNSVENDFDKSFVLKTDVRNVVFASFFTEKEVLLSNQQPMSPSQSNSALSGQNFVNHFSPFSCFHVTMIDESWTKTTFDVRQTFCIENDSNLNSPSGNIKKSVSASSLNSVGNVKKSTSATNLNNGMNNSLSQHNIDLNGIDFPLEFESDVIEKVEFIEKMKIPFKSMRFCGFNEHVVVGGLTSYIISKGQTKHLTKQFLCIASDNKWLLAVCADSIIYLFSRSCIDTPKMLFHFYREFPYSACVNSKFHVFIIGTKDGFLSIYQIKKKTSIKTIDLDSFLPRKIVVSPSWGFIVTYASKMVDNKRKYALFVHSINGDLIRSVTIPYEISAMTAMKSKSGFDYIAVANRNGAVFVFEAYYLSIEKPAMKLDSPAVALAYNKKLKCLVAVASDGTINFKSIENILV